MTDAPALFAGLKVIDCASYIAGPSAALILGDLGAEVIKVEAPGEGDPYRGLYRRPVFPATEHNWAWMMDNRNKRGLAIDLKAPAGRAVLERLVAQADVFVTNQPLPVRERLRLRYADFAEKYPRLIYASITAYGETGDEAGKTGFDEPGFDVEQCPHGGRIMDPCRSLADAASGLALIDRRRVRRSSRSRPRTCACRRRASSTDPWTP